MAFFQKGETSSSIGSPDPNPPDISVIVVNYNTGHLLRRMFTALKAAKGELTLEIVVVDNASTDGSVEILEKQYSDIKLIKNATNVGFGRANNQAVSHVHGRYILLLNTDAFVASDTLRKTAAFMDEQPLCGVLGVKLVSEDGSLQPSCRNFPTPLNVFLQRTGLFWLFSRTRLIDDMSWDHQSARVCDWVPGCYYLVRSEVVKTLGLFDPRFFLYCEEVDHCHRVKLAGWEVIYYPDTEVVHIGGESAKSDDVLTTVGRQISSLQVESELLYFRKYYGLTGVIVAVVLSIIADFLTALNGLRRRLDVNAIWVAWRSAAKLVRILAATRFASQPTR